MIHLFASDYDGTLFKDEVVTKEDLEAIDRFRALGHKFGIITGRSINSILEEVNEKNIPFDFISGINGGAVLDHSLQEIKVHKLRADAVIDLLKVIDDFGVRLYGINDGYDHMNIDYNEIMNGEATAQIDLIFQNGITGMYIATHSHEDSIELAGIINDRFKDFEIHCFANQNYVDVCTVYNSKSTGVDDIIDYYGYTGRAFTVGDSYNDVPMLRDHYGFLMANGVHDLAKFAKGGMVTSVAEAIDKAIIEIEKEK